MKWYGEKEKLSTTFVDGKYERKVILKDSLVLLNDIGSRYIEFTLRNYGKSSTIILNESVMAPSITDDKFLRRKNGLCGSEISFNGATILKTKKQEFLSNVKNKNNFVQILSQKLAEDGCTVLKSFYDHNIEIATTAARMSCENMTVVVGEEGTLLILLCYYTNASNCGLYFRGHKKHKSTKTTRVWNITKTRSLLGDDAAKHLLFASAFGGCESTSHIFGIGEGAIYLKLNNDHFSGTTFVHIRNISLRNQVIAN